MDKKQEHKKKGEYEEVKESDDEGRKELETLEQQVKEFENSYKRALADYQNLQKRVDDDKKNWIQLANKELLLRLLPVLDTLELAQKHIQTMPAGRQDDGLQVSIQQFLDVLKAEGVIKIETVGKDFDPMFMEAVATGEGGEGKVIEELRAGYMMQDKLLRAAQVTVGKKS